jgi:ATP-dependent DNA ligase
VSPRTRTLPDVQPILLTPRRDPFDDPGWLFEPKYDGYRGLLHVTRQARVVALWTARSSLRGTE